MTCNILITGAGQLGSRYLQGLSLCQRSLGIWVYDISDDSLNRTKSVGGGLRVKSTL